MVTEHNYQYLYIPELCESEVFSHPGDAQRFIVRHGLKCEVLIIELSIRLEYQVGPIWQSQRYYRTPEYAFSGFERYKQQAVGTWAGNSIWRLLDLQTDVVLAEAQPNTAIQPKFISFYKKPLVFL